MKVTLSAPCHFGLESVLSSEIRRMGGENVQVTDGRVTFDGDENLIARANIGLRTAERVQLVLGRFEARSFEELFQGVRKIPFEDYIGRKDAFPVKSGWALKSQLHSIPDCQSIIKKAIVTRLQEAYGVHWFEESGPTCAIEFSIHHDQVMISLDTTGVGLHKRGYRRSSVIAPIKETLAAGIIDIAHVYPDSQLYDRSRFGHPAHRGGHARHAHRARSAQAILRRKMELAAAKGLAAGAPPRLRPDPAGRHLPRLRQRHRPGGGGAGPAQRQTGGRRRAPSRWCSGTSRTFLSPEKKVW